MIDAQASVLRAAHSSHIFVFRFYPEARRVHFPVIWLTRYKMRQEQRSAEQRIAPMNLNK